jgi:hypothetical protein
LNIEVHGDALRLLDHLIQYATLYPQRFADVMGYGVEEFICLLRLLDKAFREASINPAKGKTGGSKKEQPRLPVDFDQRFPEPMGGKIREWLIYKTERKDFYSPTGLSHLLAQIENRVEKHSAELVMDLIAECMSNNWAGIIWDKIDQRTARSYGQRYLHAKERTLSSWNDFFLDDHNEGA